MMIIIKIVWNPHDDTCTVGNGIVNEIFNENRRAPAMSWQFWFLLRICRHKVFRWASQKSSSGDPPLDAPITFSAVATNHGIIPNYCWIFDLVKGAMNSKFWKLKKTHFLCCLGSAKMNRPTLPSKFEASFALQPFKVWAWQKFCAKDVWRKAGSKTGSSSSLLIYSSHKSGQCMTHHEFRASQSGNMKIQYCSPIISNCNDLPYVTWV